MTIEQVHENLFMSDLTKIKLDAILNDPKVQPARLENNKCIHRMKDTPVAYRMANSWTEMGILADNRKDKSKWRKFSTLDLYWIQIVLSLRKFGLSIEIIKMIYDKLFSEKETIERGMLEWSVLEALNGNPIFMIVFPDGKFGVVTFEELVLSEQIYKLRNYIKIELNELVYSLYYKEGMKVVFKPTLSLSNEELSVVENIRSGQFESIKIKAEKDSILIEGEKDIDISSRIIDVLNSAHYQKIELSETKGKVTHIKQIVQKKIQEEKNSPEANRLSMLLNKSELRPYIKAENVGSKTKRLL